MLQEHHHMPQNGMQRSTRMGMPQMGPPSHRSQPMLMSIQPPAPVSHAGVLVQMPMISTNSILQPQPKMYHYENVQDADTPSSPESQTVPTTLSVQPTLANIKEKTPMCLVNELARYNKIQHQYQLTEESGPAHKKVFTVTLMLGGEEYREEGPSIKKAQHAAAARALAKTEFKHPPSKAVRARIGACVANGCAQRGANSSVMTPTVELNALAMKRGERPIYIVENQGSHHNQAFQPGYYPRQNIYNQNPTRYGFNTRRNLPHYSYHENRCYTQYRAPLAPPTGEPYTVRLRVGDREYPGVGFTVQAARHDAAAKAIDEIRQLDDPPLASPAKDAKDDAPPAADPNTEIKSPVSLVHEIALKRNLTVTFDVLSEKGPPHMKVFVTQCRVGTFSADGEGNGKKISKKRAAEKMLDELAKLPPMPNLHPVVHLKRKKVASKKKTRNLIKITPDKASSEFVEEINPISRLIQIQQANKEREPVYTVLEERGAPRRREFVIEASANGQSCTGIGPNKKAAKRTAAEALLALLGHAKPQVPPAPAARKVQFVEERPEAPPGGSGGRQLVPGVLLVGEPNGFRREGGSPETGRKPLQGRVAQPVQGGVRSKDQLMYLAQLMNILVQFSDFPKANHEMYLTLVSLGTNPPQVCHGEGPTTEESHEKASLEALKVLSELGLDIVGPPSKETSNE